MAQALLSEEVKTKWDEVITAEGVAPIEDVAVRNTTIRVLENTVQEAVTTTTGFGATGPAKGTYDPVLISMVRRTMPSLVAHDLVGVQAMSGPTGLIFAMKAHYGADGTGNEAFGLVAPNPQTTGNLSGVNATGNADTTASGEVLGTGKQVTEAGVAGTVTPLAEANPWPEMSFEISKVSVEAKARALKAKYTMELAQDLKAIHGLDAESELSNILSGEVVGEINREIIAHIRFGAKHTAGVANANAFTGAGKINAVGGFDPLALDAASNLTNTGIFDVAGVKEINGARWAVEKYKMLYLQLVRESTTIAQETRRGVGNTIICSPMVAAALEQVSKLDTGMGIGSGNPMNQDFVGASFAGILGGRFKLYIDPYAQADFVTIGYKGNSVYDAGIFYCPYVPLQMMKAVGEDDFQPRIGMKTRYGIAYNPFVTAPTVTGNNQYYREFLVSNL